MDPSPYSTPPSQPPLPPPVTITNNWRLYLELSAFSFFFFPFGNIFGPLLLWIIKKDTDATVNEEGKKVINFNLSWTIWMFVSCGLFIPVWIVVAFIAILRAANNQSFKHPLTISFLR